MPAVKTGFTPPPMPGMPAPMQPMGGVPPMQNPFAPMPPMPLAGMPPPPMPPMPMPMPMPQTAQGQQMMGSTAGRRRRFGDALEGMLGRNQGIGAAMPQRPLPMPQMVPRQQMVAPGTPMMRTPTPRPMEMGGEVDIFGYKGGGVVVQQNEDGTSSIVFDDKPFNYMPDYSPTVNFDTREEADAFLSRYNELSDSARKRALVQKRAAAERFFEKNPQPDNEEYNAMKESALDSFRNTQKFRDYEGGPVESDFVKQNLLFKSGVSTDVLDPRLLKDQDFLNQLKDMGVNQIIRGGGGIGPTGIPEYETLRIGPTGIRGFEGEELLGVYGLGSGARFSDFHNRSGYSGELLGQVFSSPVKEYNPSDFLNKITKYEDATLLGKPTVDQFMAITGVSEDEAREAVNMGGDLRNWGLILQSEDPYQAAMDAKKEFLYRYAPGNPAAESVPSAGQYIYDVPEVWDETLRNYADATPAQKQLLNRGDIVRFKDVNTGDMRTEALLNPSRTDLTRLDRIKDLMGVGAIPEFDIKDYENLPNYADAFREEYGRSPTVQDFADYGYTDPEASFEGIYGAEGVDPVGSVDSVLSTDPAVYAGDVIGSGVNTSLYSQSPLFSSPEIGEINLPPRPADLNIFDYLSDPTYGSLLENQVYGMQDGGEAIPRRTNIYGVPHELSYINDEEKALLKGLGGMGTPGPGGVPQYNVFEKIKSFFSGGGGNDNSSSASTNNNDSALGKFEDSRSDLESAGYTVSDDGNAVYSSTGQVAGANWSGSGTVNSIVESNQNNSYDDNVTARVSGMSSSGSNVTPVPTGTVDFTLPPTPDNPNPPVVATIDYGSDDDDGPVIKDVTYYDDTGTTEIDAPVVTTSPAYVNPNTGSVTYTDRFGRKYRSQLEADIANQMYANQLASYGAGKVGFDRFKADAASAFPGRPREETDRMAARAYPDFVEDYSRDINIFDADVPQPFSYTGIGGIGAGPEGGSVGIKSDPLLGFDPIASQVYEPSFINADVMGALLGGIPSLEGGPVISLDAPLRDGGRNLDSDLGVGSTTVGVTADDLASGTGAVSFPTTAGGSVTFTADRDANTRLINSMVDAAVAAGDAGADLDASENAHLKAGADALLGVDLVQSDLQRGLGATDRQTYYGGSGPRDERDIYQAPAESVIAKTIAGFEGRTETPYWDVNANRAGYGSDTKTDPKTGEVTKITSDTKVSKAEADADLNRRLTTEFIPRVVDTVGANTFYDMTPEQQAALTSITYNYGELPARVASVVNNVDPSTPEGQKAISDAIRSLEGDNDGVNRDRRNAEADLFLGQGDVPETSVVTKSDTGVSPEKRDENVEKIKKQIGDQADPTGVESFFYNVIGQLGLGLGKGFADKLRNASKENRQAIIDQHLYALENGATPKTDEEGNYIGFDISTMDTFADKMLAADDIMAFMPPSTEASSFTVTQDMIDSLRASGLNAQADALTVGQTLNLPAYSNLAYQADADGDGVIDSVRFGQVYDAQSTAAAEDPYGMSTEQGFITSDGREFFVDATGNVVEVTDGTVPFEVGGGDDVAAALGLTETITGGDDDDTATAGPDTGHVDGVCNNPDYVYNPETDMCEPPAEEEGSDTVSSPITTAITPRSFDEVLRSVVVPAPDIAPISANIRPMQGGGMAGLNRAADNFLKALAG